MFGRTDKQTDHDEWNHIWIYYVKYFEAFQLKQPS